MSDQPAFICPACKAISYHPEDIRNGYCGRCHAYTGESRGWVITDARDYEIKKELRDSFDATLDNYEKAKAGKEVPECIKPLVAAAREVIELLSPMLEMYEKAHPEVKK